MPALPAPSPDVATAGAGRIDVADAYAFAIFQRLLVGIRHILEARAHDRQRFGVASAERWRAAHGRHGHA
jgi:hypothetical protein